MTGAMYAAISGLKAHMEKLNVIGNNIANVNTYGYKAARTTFRESLYTTLTSGSNGTAAAGGVNPSQIGYGCSVGTIDLDMSTKNYVPTGKSLDCMINGDGFFMVGGKPDATTTDPNSTLAETDAKSLNLTRVGDFGIDSQGYLADSAGNVVYGFVTVSGTGPAASTPGGLADKDNPKVSTQLVPIRVPLVSKTDGSAVYPGVGADGMNIYDSGAGDSAKSTGVAVKLDSIAIDGKTGKITGVMEGGEQVVVGYIAMAKVSNPSGVTHINGPYYKAMEGAGSCDATSLNNAVSEVCYNKTTNGPNLDNKADDATGGVTRVGSTGQTELITGGLESSGTDLATEIAEMISTQRGYQANTRIITVTDSMLEELVNMKR